MEFINLDQSSKELIKIAKAISQKCNHDVYDSSHLLLGLMHKEVGILPFLEYHEQDVDYIKQWAEMRLEELPIIPTYQGIPTAGIHIAKIFEEADHIRLKLGLLEINPFCILIALCKPDIGFSVDQLRSFSLREGALLDLFLEKHSNSSTTFIQNTEQSDNNILNSPKNPTLKNLHLYCINKSKQDVKDTTPIIGRHKELRMIAEILGRFGKANVLLIGESGVGKTALIEGLIQQIKTDSVPSFLQGAQVFELDKGNLIAGATYKGEIEDRVKNIIQEIRTFENPILFIDEIHSILDSKQNNNGVAAILKPELSKGNITLIATTTIEDYRKLIEPDPTLQRHFESVTITEPTIEQAIKILINTKQRFTSFHNLDISDDAIEQAVHLAKRYSKDRKLPDSAIDLMDRTMSSAKMINQTANDDVENYKVQLNEIKNNSELSSQLQTFYANLLEQISPILIAKITDSTDINEIKDTDTLYTYILEKLNNLSLSLQNPYTVIESPEIASIIASITGIPIGKVQAQEKEKLLAMEGSLQKRVVGQDHAIKVLVDAILESRSGMNKAGQPIGSFFFLGPTGTGKTELAKALAENLFNDEKAMIRFDMSEFKEEHSAALLYGAPPGYVGYEEGGLLVNKIRQQPYSVVLFDEIEKAHPSVYDIFLQIMDEGKIHDRLGKEGDFSNAIILFTSNVGSQWIAEQKEKGLTPSTTELMDVMTQYFRPEFLARISEIVPFSPITEIMLLKIFDIQLKSLITALEKQGISINIEQETKQLLASKGFTPKYGARQIVGNIRTYLRRPISKMIINAELPQGSTLEVKHDKDNQLTWNIIKNEQ